MRKRERESESERECEKLNGHQHKCLQLFRKHRQNLHLVIQRNVSANPLSPYSPSGVIGSTSLPFLSSSYNDLPSSVAGRKASFPVGGSQILGVERNGRQFSDVGGMTQPADMLSYSHDDSMQWLRSINSSRERVALSKEKLPEVPEEANSQAANVSPPPSVHFRQASTGTEHPRKSGAQGQTSQRSPTTQDYAASSTGGNGMKFSFSQPSHLDGTHAGLGAMGSRKLSLGSPDGDGGLFGLAMQSVASRPSGYYASQSSSHTYQPRSFYSSKVSTSSVESDSDSAYITGHSSRSLNHEEGHCTSPHAFCPQRPKDSNQRSPTSMQFPAGMLTNGHHHEEELEDEMVDPTVDWDVSIRNIVNCTFSQCM